MGNPNCCFMIIAVAFFSFSQSPRGTVYYQLTRQMVLSYRLALQHTICRRLIKKPDAIYHFYFFEYVNFNKLLNNSMRLSKFWFCLPLFIINHEYFLYWISWNRLLRIPVNFTFFLVWLLLGQCRILQIYHSVRKRNLLKAY